MKKFDKSVFGRGKAKVPVVEEQKVPVIEEQKVPVIEEQKVPVVSGIVKVVAVICPMYSPVDDLLIPDEGKGVRIKENSWATSQIERGLLRVVE